MASLVESGLKNVNYGDADSIGLFQMRRSIWDQGPYRGYGRRPELQLRWFLDHAEAVKRGRQQSGAGLGPRSYGEWIADIERPAAQYRGRYQLRLDEARDLLAQARSRSTQGSGSNHAGILPVVDSDGGKGGLRASIVENARSFVGTPYVWGGTSPRGFDCSGFVQYVYARAGIPLPRVSFQQANAGTRIPLNDLRPGDLVAWDNSSRNNGADHIAIYLGHGRIAEAPRTGIDLRVRRLGQDEGAWGSRVIGRR
jgi:hypothetical protein